METWGVVFDLDGILVESGIYHRDAWKAFARAHGTEITDEWFWSTFGQRNDELLPLILGRELSAEEIWTLSEEKEKRFREAASGRLEMLSGAPRLVEALRDQGIPMAIGSSTPRSNMDFFLDELELRDTITAVVCGDDVTKGKPDPEVFAKAAERIGQAPEKTVVFEDAVAGLQAAKTAGARAIGVTTSVSANSLREAAPDLIVDDLSELTVERLAELIWSFPTHRHRHE